MRDPRLLGNTFSGSSPHFLHRFPASIKGKGHGLITAGETFELCEEGLAVLSSIWMNAYFVCVITTNRNRHIAMATILCLGLNVVASLSLIDSRKLASGLACGASHSRGGRPM